MTLIHSFLSFSLIHAKVLVNRTSVLPNGGPFRTKQHALFLDSAVLTLSNLARLVVDFGLGELSSVYTIRESVVTTMNLNGHFPIFNLACFLRRMPNLRAMAGFLMISCADICACAVLEFRVNVDMI